MSKRRQQNREVKMDKQEKTKQNKLSMPRQKAERKLTKLFMCDETLNDFASQNLYSFINKHTSLIKEKETFYRSFFLLYALGG